MKQILIALDYCHKNNYVHRAVTVDNILITKGKSNTIKLIDFSSCCVRDTPKPYLIAKSKRKVENI